MISEITDRRRIFEILAVILTGFSKVLFINILKLHAVYILSAIIFWVTYFVYRVFKNRNLIYYWGLSVNNLKQTFKVVSVAGTLAIGAFIVMGFYKNTLLLVWNLVFVLLTYPLWGLVQQFMVMSILANNLRDYRGGQLNYYLVVLITSLTFSVVHFPSIPLIIATFLMAVFYSVVFLKYRNIIPLGIFHGIMGGLFYYLVLGKDTWSLFIRIFV